MKRRKKMKKIIESCKLIDKVKCDDDLTVLEDSDATIEEENVVGNFVLGRRNERGNKLTEFCFKHNFVITNTLFKLNPRKRYKYNLYLIIFFN